MASPALFKVLTEFRFDIGHAVLGSQTLASEVGKISSAADGALNTLTNLSLRFAANFGLGSTGVVGLLGKGVVVADKFNSSALQFSSILSGNFENLQGDVDTFNKRLQFSKQFLTELSQISFKFGLPEEQIAETAKNLAGALIPKGLAGDNLSNVGDLSRNVLKAAPILNLNVGDIQNQLINALLGGASLQGQLFRRLVAETTALSPFGGTGGTKRFNELDAAERFTLLRKAFEQFTADAGVLEAQANTLSGVFNRLTILTSGAISVFKPLGDVILPVIIKVMNQFIDVLNTKGRRVFENLAKLLKPLADNPRGALESLLQFRELSSDLSTAVGITGLALTIFHIKEFIKLAKSLGGVLSNAATSGIAAGTAGGAGAGIGAFLGTIFETIKKTIALLLRPSILLKTVLGALRFAVTKVFVPIAALLTLFQLFSAASAKARVNDALELPNLAERLSAVMLRLQKSVAILIEPFTFLFDALADGLAPLFSIFQSGFLSGVGISALEGVAFLLDNLARGFIFLQGTLAGMMAVVIESVSRIADLSTGDFGAFSGFDIGSIFEDAVIDQISQKLDPLNNALKDITVNNKTEIGNIEIRNDFKERIEPDRVAFSLVDQLQKLAQNPTQAQGRSTRPIEER